MPGKGKPFVKGDPRIQPGPGKPPDLVRKSWKEAIEGRSPKALGVLDGVLDGAIKSGLRYSAARDVVNWTDPERNKQKNELSGSVEVVVTYADHKD